MKADAKTEAAVMNAFNNLWTAYEKRDWKALSSLFIPDTDVSLYGTGADEKRIGLKEIKAQVERDWSQSQSASLKFTWQAVSAVGPVAWVMANGAVHAKVDGQSVTMPVRQTAIFEQRQGKWLVAHFHVSMPAGEQAAGESFTPSGR